MFINIPSSMGWHLHRPRHHQQRNGLQEAGQELNQFLAYARSNAGIRNSNYRKLPQFKENILLTIAGNCCFKK